MIILSGTEASLAVAIVTIGYGVRWERRYIAWIAVVMNVVFATILLASVNLPLQIIIAFIPYLILGGLCAWQHWRSVFFLFGTRAFGALALTLVLYQINALAWINWIYHAIGLSSSILQDGTFQILMMWLILAIVIQILGWKLTPEDEEAEDD